MMTSNDYLNIVTCNVTAYKKIAGSSLQVLDKETVMQPHTSSIPLYVNHIDNIQDLLLAVLECLELAADHPDRTIDSSSQAILLRFAQALVLTLIESYKGGAV